MTDLPVFNPYWISKPAQQIVNPVTLVIDEHWPVCLQQADRLRLHTACR
jgi:hypothetical protein